MHNKFAKKLTQLGLISAVAGIAACTQTTNDTVLAQFHTEAGAVLNAGLNQSNLGYATTNNTLVQTGQLNYAVNLQKRFSEEAPAMVNFAFNSAVLDEEAKAALRRQADWIKQFPEVRFKVFGHTDLVGSNGYNRRLGMRRARAVVGYLSRLGISRSRLQAVVSKGETQPLVATQARERRNRRTVTVVSGFVRNHPTVLDGKYAQIVYREYVESATGKTKISPLTILP